ncbi:3017_t:CDS:2 [Diversispora eburnea]|uniref:3017_t:CDS:1 n=1 Tax=Diversispora eburnea TaxID=1213867 RepID=A0A9N9CQV7_9GLOM|nr:3017_t:CDS:2 [Diversispora eburnea]
MDEMIFLPPKVRFGSQFNSRMDNSNNPPKSKCNAIHRQGQGVHVSDFLTETISPLKDEYNIARVTMVLDANSDGYWNGEKLVIQLLCAIDIFEHAHPNCIVIWAFDNATSHTAFAANALVASKMNKGPSGAVPNYA